jgi:hypothetical protein
MSYSVCRARARSLADRIEASPIATSSSLVCTYCRDHSWTCIRSTLSVRCSNCVRNNRRCVAARTSPVSSVRVDIGRIRASLSALDRYLATSENTDDSLSGGSAPPQLSALLDASHYSPGSTTGALSPVHTTDPIESSTITGGDAAADSSSEVVSVSGIVDAMSFHEGAAAVSEPVPNASSTAVSVASLLNVPGLSLSFQFFLFSIIN